MTKLHELLAVEGDLEGVSKKIIDEANKTFKDKPAHFLGATKHWDMFDEVDQLNAPTDEHQKMVTTVNQKLEFVSKKVGKYYDAVLQKESTNQLAKSDLIVDGDILAKDVPATFLLGMEKRLKELRNMMDSMPTLQAGKAWERDDSTNTYKMVHPDVRFKTAKTFQHKVLYDATPEHPAQIERWEETKNVGKSVQDVWSGMLSVKEKADMMERVDNLMRGVKKARMRANNVEAVKSSIGSKMFQYIIKGKI